MSQSNYLQKHPTANYSIVITLFPMIYYYTGKWKRSTCVLCNLRFRGHESWCAGFILVFNSRIRSKFSSFDEGSGTSQVSIIKLTHGWLHDTPRQSCSMSHYTNESNFSDASTDQDATRVMFGFIHTSPTNPIRKAVIHVCGGFPCVCSHKPGDSLSSCTTTDKHTSKDKYYDL